VPGSTSAPEGLVEFTGGLEGGSFTTVGGEEGICIVWLRVMGELVDVSCVLVRSSISSVVVREALRAVERRVAPIVEFNVASKLGSFSRYFDIRLLARELEDVEGRSWKSSMWNAGGGLVIVGGLGPPDPCWWVSDGGIISALEKAA